MEAPNQNRSLQLRLAAERAIDPLSAGQALCQFGDEADLKQLQDKPKQ